MQTLPWQVHSQKGNLLVLQQALEEKDGKRDMDHMLLEKEAGVLTDGKLFLIFLIPVALVLIWWRKPSQRVVAAEVVEARIDMIESEIEGMRVHMKDQNDQDIKLQ